MKILALVAVLVAATALSGCGSQPCTGLEHVFGNEADRARCGGKGFYLSYTTPVDLSGAVPVMPRQKAAPPP